MDFGRPLLEMAPIEVCQMNEIVLQPFILPQAMAVGKCRGGFETCLVRGNISSLIV